MKAEIKMLTAVVIIGISALLSIDIILYSIFSCNRMISLLSLITIIPILLGLKMYVSAEAEMKESEQNEQESKN
jgi:cadmium resistance protein CadD (predicted permease)